MDKLKLKVDITTTIHNEGSPEEMTELRTADDVELTVAYVDPAHADELVKRWNTFPDLLAALKAATERMEAVSQKIPVHNRSEGVSQAAHVAHMAGHLEQHAKIARAAITKAEQND